MIYTNKIYIVKSRKGISGFRSETEFHTFMVRGDKARSNKGWYESIDPYCPRNFRNSMFEICDGHLPGYRPTVSPDAAYEYVSNTPGGQCELVEPNQ